MEIYIDYIFIQNFLLDTLLLLQTQRLSKVKATRKNIILSAIVSSTYICIMLCFKFEFLDSFTCKIFLSFIVVFIAFVPKKINEYIKLVGIYYLITIINTGACIFVSQLITNNKEQSIIIKIFTYMISALITYLYTKEFWKIYKSKLKEKSLIYEALLKIGKKYYKYKGFLDTGNIAYSYSLSAPVIFAEMIAESQMLELENEEYSYIDISTISKVSNERVYDLEIKIGNNSYKVGVVFLKNKLDKNEQYNMILNYEIFEEMLGGISI